MLGGGADMSVRMVLDQDGRFSKMRRCEQHVDVAGRERRMDRRRRADLRRPDGDRCRGSGRRFTV